MRPLIYLASVYSKYPHGRLEAYKDICKKAAQLMESGHHVFCPIAHSHSIEVEGMCDTKDGDWWLEQDFAVLERCDELWVYMMDGWKESYGVQKEIAFALERRIPVYYLSCDQGSLEEKEAA